MLFIITWNPFQYETLDIVKNQKNQQIPLNFAFFSSDMFIVFTDQDNNIIKNKTFTDLKILLNGQEAVENTCELLKYDTIEKYGKFEGYYYINLENFKYGMFHHFDEMVNFSVIDTVCLKMTLTDQFINSTLKVHVGVISYNCLRYHNHMVGPLYYN